MTVQQTLQELAKGLSTAAIGQDFFQSMAHYLSKTLEVDYVFIGELTNLAALTHQNQQVRSVVFLAHGKIAEEVEYPLVGSLCEHVVKATCCAFPRNVQQQFPDNKALKRFGVDSYIGTPLFATTGKVIGLIYVMHRAPIEEVAKTESLLQIVAKRTELELARAQQERELQENNQTLQQVNEALTRAQQALKEANQELEQRIEQRTAELQAANAQIYELLNREKAARLEAENQQKQVEMLFLQAPVAIGIFGGPDYRIELANESLCAIWGKPLEEVLGKPLLEALPEIKEQCFADLLYSVFTTGKPFKGNELPRLVTRDGKQEQLYLNLVYEARHAPDGSITGIIVVASEVTEQVLARKQVEESERSVRRLLDSIPQIAWTALADSCSITFFNQRWYEYSGLSEEQSLRQGWTQVLHPEDLPLALARSRVGRGENQPYEMESRYRRHDGTYRWYLSRMVPIRNTEDKVILWVGSATDIHDQKMAMEALQQTLTDLHGTQQKLETILRELNEKNYELDQFVYKTSHDLRAPLSTILGLVTILKQEQEQGIQMQYVELIENRVHKLDKFIGSMLDYSRNTRMAIHYEKIDFKALIEECAAELEYMKHCSRLHICLSITEKDFYSDVFRLKIIFSNLISNAIKYQDFAKQQSSLTITISITQKQAKIHFLDNGVGIKPEYQEQVFNMFFRAAEQSDGSGLGLYIIKQAIEKLNGRIELESRTGIETHFLITLPNAMPAIQAGTQIPQLTIQFGE